jgi:hypothetical protein
VDPLNGLRSMGKRMTEQAEPRAQEVAERVVDLVVRSLDVNALVQQIDLNAVLSQIDVNALVDRVDLNKVLSQVDVNALLSRVDINQLVDQVDVNALVDRVDINEVAQSLDIDALAAHTDLGTLIAKSSGGIAADVLDVVRSEAVGLDEFIARWVGRLRRRRYSGPPGPPELLRPSGAEPAADPPPAADPAASRGPAIGTVQP